MTEPRYKLERSYKPVHSGKPHSGWQWWVVDTHTDKQVGRKTRKVATARELVRYLNAADGE